MSYRVKQYGKKRAYIYESGKVTKIEISALMRGTANETIE